MGSRITFPGSLDQHFMKQWQYTIFILDLIIASVKTICLLAQTGEGNITMLTSFVTFCLALLMIGYEYLGLYVDLSKI